MLFSHRCLVSVYMEIPTQGRICGSIQSQEFRHILLAYTGNKITATSILVAPNIQGGYATFNHAMTGTTFNALTSVKSTLLSGTTHSGSNAYFSSITGS